MHEEYGRKQELKNNEIEEKFAIESEQMKSLLERKQQEYNIDK